jgi:hypothetical protein
MVHVVGHDLVSRGAKLVGGTLAVLCALGCYDLGRFQGSSPDASPSDASTGDAGGFLDGSAGDAGELDDAAMLKSSDAAAETDDPAAPCSPVGDEKFFACLSFDEPVEEPPFLPHMVEPHTPQLMAISGPYFDSGRFQQGADTPEVVTAHLSTGARISGRTVDTWVRHSQGRFDLALEDVSLSIDEEGKLLLSEVSVGELPLTDDWHHLAITIADKRATLYLDGKFVADQPTTILHADVTAKWPTNRAAFAGYIDTVRVWDRALTVAGVCQLAGRTLEGGECKVCEGCTVPEECPEGDDELLGCFDFGYRFEDQQGRFELSPHDYHVDEAKGALDCSVSDLRLTELPPLQHTLQVWVSHHAEGWTGNVVNVEKHYRFQSSRYGFGVDATDGLFDIREVGHVDSKPEDPPHLLTIVRDGKKNEMSFYADGVPVAKNVAVAPPRDEPSESPDVGSICSGGLLSEEHFAGFMYALRVFHGIRSAADICADSGKSLVGDTCE